ncbi:MAG: tryptophan--tRNA ligase, partial [Nonomuraea sp.]|nr:tryptophan--tRNA ligase [Nonomuraea sp.]
LKEVEKITDLQDPTAKMSKSSSSPAGILDVLEQPGPLRKKVMRAVTDTGSEVLFDEENKPGISNLLRIQSALTGTPIPELVARYEGQGYGTFKKDVAEAVVEAFTPIRERTEKLLADEAELDRLLSVGAERASAVARKTMAEVRDRVGFLPKL